MGFYEKLGIRPVINGYATLTRLGGSRMPPVVLEAMAAASTAFVHMDELHEVVGERIANLTRNEAAYVSCGAAAGMVLAAAACMAGTDRALMAAFPHTEGMKDEIIVHRAQRNPYDYALRQTGARLVEIGCVQGTEPWELEASIGRRTACIVYFAGEHLAKGALPLKTVVEISHRRGVPVVVDAAAQLPPPANLWRFTAEMGVDLAIFSGGKGLCGPQNTGLVLGRRDLVRACAAHACPNHAIGRPMKVGKEDLAGILAAVEWYLGLDHEALMQRYERQVAAVVEALNGQPGVSVRRDFPSEAGQPIPRALVMLGAGAPLDRDAVLEGLKRGNPRIELAPADHDGMYVNPQTLEEGEEQIVIDRLGELLGGVRGAARRTQPLTGVWGLSGGTQEEAGHLGRGTTSRKGGRDHGRGPGHRGGHRPALPG